jgi:hypothetical protein
MKELRFAVLACLMNSTASAAKLYSLCKNANNFFSQAASRRFLHRCNRAPISFASPVRTVIVNSLPSKKR